MNPKLKIALIRRSSERGFVMPAVMGLGIVMLLVGATMIVRSQGDRVTAATQRSTAQGLSVTEAGLTQAQALLKVFPKLAKADFSNWPAIYSANYASCTAANVSSALIGGSWVNVDPANANKGQFRILSYTYDTATQTGTVKVQGKLDSSNVSNSTKVLQANVPVVALQGVPVPGLWAEGFSMGNNQVDGNILVYGCGIPSGVSSANIVPGSTSTLTSSVSVAFPELPELPTFTATVNGLPSTQAAVCSAVATPPALPTVPCYQLYFPAGATAATLSGNIPQEIEPNVTLPRATDIAGSDGIYRYLVGKNGSGNSIDLSGSDQITIDPTKKVILYLQGNINMAGNTKLVHTGTATDFQIFGSDGAGKYKHPNDTTAASSYKTTSLIIGGNTSATMFIYAPEATAGINGGGNQPVSITGSVWVKAWNGSNANQTVVAQNANWDQLALTRPTTIASFQTWQPQEAP